VIYVIYTIAHLFVLIEFENVNVKHLVIFQKTVFFSKLSVNRP